MDAWVDEEVPWHPVSVGATRPVVVSIFLNAPLWSLGFVIGIPFGVLLLTHSIVIALVLLVLLLGLARWSVVRDHYRPRSWWLAFMSGTLLADTRTYGGVSDDPLGD